MYVYLSAVDIRVKRRYKKRENALEPYWRSRFPLPGYCIMSRRENSDTVRRVIQCRFPLEFSVSAGCCRFTGHPSVTKSTCTNRKNYSMMRMLCTVGSKRRHVKDPFRKPEVRHIKIQGSRALCPRFIHDLFKHVLQVMYFIGFCQFLIKAVV